MRALKEASQAGHLTLALMAMLYAGTSALLLTTVGAWLLSRRWRTSRNTEQVSVDGASRGMN
jgi:ABC-type nickel/cobalt efflux system permease component RcnA